MIASQDHNAPEFETYLNAPDSVAFEFFGVGPGISHRFRLGERVFRAVPCANEFGSHLWGVTLVTDPDAQRGFFITPLAPVRVRRYGGIPTGYASGGRHMYGLEDAGTKGKWWLLFGTTLVHGGRFLGQEKFMFDPLPEARVGRREA